MLTFLLAILIPASESSSPASHTMYSAYKLNKKGDNMQPWRPPFPIWNQSVAPCPVLTVPSCPAYRFLRRQVRWSGIPISSRIFQFWSTQRLLHSQWSRSRFFLIPLLFLWSRLCSSKSSLLILHNSVNIAYFVLFMWLCLIIWWLSLKSSFMQLSFSPIQFSLQKLSRILQGPSWVETPHTASPPLVCRKRSVS